MKQRVDLKQAKISLRQLRSLKILVSTIFLATCSMSPFMIDSFTLPKLTVLSIGLLLVSISLTLTAKITLPAMGYRTISMILSGLIISMLLANFNTQVPLTRALLGQFSRGNGMLYYFLAFSIFIFTFLLYDDAADHFLERAATYLLFALSSYGLLQSVGIDFAKLDTRDLSPIVLTFGNSNFAGALLSVLFTFKIILIALRMTIKKFEIIVLLITILTIYLTKAFQGIIIVFLAIFVSISFYLLNRFKSKQTYRSLTTVWGILILGLILNLLNLLPVKSILSRSTFQIRIEYWKIGLEVLGENLFFGIGADRLYDFSGFHMPPGKMALVSLTRIDNAHNWLIQFGLSFGLFAFIFYLAFLATVLVIGIKSLRSWKERSNVQIAAFVSFLMISLDLFVSMEQPGLGIWLYFFAGIVITNGRNLTRVSNISGLNATGLLTRQKLLKTFSLLLSFFLFLSSVFTILRSANDIELRSSLVLALNGPVDARVADRIYSQTIELRSEPEYAIKAIPFFAQAGIASVLDDISATYFNYYPKSIAAQGIRFEVLNGLGKSQESCSIVKSLLRNTPWDYKLIRPYVACQVNAGSDSDVVTTLQLVWPYIKMETLTDDQLKVANEETLFNTFQKLAVNVRILDYLNNTVDLKNYLLQANSIYGEIEKRQKIGEFSDLARFNFTESLKLLSI
jgi:hypothetical protein